MLLILLSLILRYSNFVNFAISSNELILFLDISRSVRLLKFSKPERLSIFVLLIKIYIDEYGNSQLEEG